MEILNLKTRIIDLNNMYIKKNYLSDQEIIIKNKDSKYEKLNNSLKLSNTQSFSTGADDIKEAEIKESLSQKNLKIFNNSSFVNKSHIVNKQFLNLFSKDTTINKNDNNINLFKNKISNKITTNKKYFINIITLFEKVLNHNKLGNNKKEINNDVNNFDFNKKLNNKKKIKNNVNIKILRNEKDNIIIYKNNNIKFENALKIFPPNIPCLFNHNYKLLDDGYKNFINSKCYNKFNKSEVPNVFYNHIMMKNKIFPQKNRNFYSISTTNRIKGKLLTIIYFTPIKII